MDTPELNFVVPTYRLRDVAETILDYDHNFHRGDHAVRMMVFDDGTAANRRRYLHRLERLHLHHDLLYVGPAEKAAFVDRLLHRLGHPPSERVVQNLFKPSYGGNRNVALMYTLGSHFLSADDDMRPHARVAHTPRALLSNQVCHGHLAPIDAPYHTRAFDIIAAFREVLGKVVATLPKRFVRGAAVADSAMDLETNASRGLVNQNTLTIMPGHVPRDAVIKMAQTYRSGTSDIDALDYVEMFLADARQTTIDALNQVYILETFRPAVTAKNWRMDCGVAGYDNRVGLPPFFPTRLRCEDYVYRMWVQQPGIAAAHVDAAQNHMRSNYMRDALAADVFNEEMCNLIKRKLAHAPYTARPLTVEFMYDGHVATQDIAILATRMRDLAARVMTHARRTRDAARQQALRALARALSHAFADFAPIALHAKVAAVVQKFVQEQRAAMALWPTLVDIVLSQRGCELTPSTRVNSRSSHGSRHAHCTSHFECC